MSDEGTPDGSTDPLRPPPTDRRQPGSGFRTGVLAAVVVAAGLPALAGCGGGDAEPTATGDEATGERTTGGEATAGDDAGTDPALGEEDVAPEVADADADEEDAEVADQEGDDEAGAEAEVAAEEPDPRVVWRRKVRRGRRVFERVCGVCHPGGEEDLGPRIIGKRLSTRSMRRQIRQGIGRMRPIPPSKLPDRYMDELFAYLSTIRAVRGVSRP